jgi:probable selenium-dependent hydroxylase accessory protein YqeC
MTLLEALELRLPEVVALTGAGGKTTTMLQLAREARAAGLRILITVTTKIFEPDPEEFGSPVFDAAELAGKQLAVYASGSDTASGKLLGIPPEAIPRGFDLVLVEADGSAGKPLTAPREYEPVIPAATTTVLALAGLDAMDQPVASMHRPEVIRRLAGVAQDAPVSIEVITAVLEHPEGAAKGRPEGSRVIYVLNKADDEMRLQQAQQIAARLNGRALITVDGLVVWPREE